MGARVSGQWQVASLGGADRAQSGLVPKIGHRGR